MAVNVTRGQMTINEQNEPGKVTHLVDCNRLARSSNGQSFTRSCAFVFAKFDWVECVCVAPTKQNMVYKGI